MKLLNQMIHPMDSFCCGCSLDFGIWIMLFYNFIQSCRFILTCVGEIVLSPNGHLSMAPAAEALNCAVALASLPFILAGWSGVKYQIEPHLRIYLAWLFAYVTLNTVLVGIAIATSNCHDLDAFSAGGAYACGALRAFHAAYAALWIIGSAYCLFIVWSKCEELEYVDSKADFQGMLDDSRAKYEAQLKKGLAQTGLYGLGAALPPARPVQYGSLGSPIFHGSGSIFGGKDHDMSYPPVAA